MLISYVSLESVSRLQVSLRPSGILVPVTHLTTGPLQCILIPGKAASCIQVSYYFYLYKNSLEISGEHQILGERQAAVQDKASGLQSGCIPETCFCLELPNCTLGMNMGMGRWLGGKVPVARHESPSLNPQHYIKSGCSSECL